jgi:hypothetical protein
VLLASLLLLVELVLLLLLPVLLSAVALLVGVGRGVRGAGGEARSTGVGGRERAGVHYVSWRGELAGSGE